MTRRRATCICAAVLLLAATRAPGQATPPDRAALARRAAGSTVQLLVDDRWDDVRLRHDPAATATAIVLTADGWLLTSAEVVADARTLTVVAEDGVPHDADLWRWSGPNDVAAVHVPDLALHPAAFGESGALAPGASLVALGHPPGGAYAASVGVVRATHRGVFPGERPRRPVHDLLQLQLDPVEGDAGAPLLDDAGRVVGVLLEARADQGVTLALPIEHARAIALALVAKGTDVAQGRILVGLADAWGLPDDVVKRLELRAREGAIVTGVEHVRSATGLEVGDRIVAFERTPVVNATHLRALAADRLEGDRVTLSIERRGQPLEVEVTLDAWWTDHGRPQEGQPDPAGPGERRWERGRDAGRGAWRAPREERDEDEEGAGGRR
jgi:S1-C subfamily serine protease